MLSRTQSAQKTDETPSLAGTAVWSFVAAVYYILGIRPHYTGLIIDPLYPLKLRWIYLSAPVQREAVYHSGRESRWPVHR